MTSSPLALRLTLDTFLLDTLWQSSLWLVAGLAVAGLVRRPARAHAVVLLAVAGAVITPLASGLFRLAGWGFLAPLGLGDPLAVDMTMATTGTGGAATADVGWETWETLAGIAWALATIVLTTRIVVSLARGRRMLHAASVIEDLTLAGIAHRAREKLGLRSRPATFISRAVSTPVIWCWGSRPCIVLPSPRADDAAAAADGMFGIMCHELAHWKRRDHLTALAAEMAVCLLPWHPLTWIARRRLRDLSEQACDAWVLALGEAPDTYAETLLGMAPRPQPTWALAAVSHRRGLVARIQRILTHRPGDPHMGKTWIITAGLATALVVAAAAATHRRSEEAAPASVVPPAPLVDTQELAPNTVRLATIPGELDLGEGPAGDPQFGSLVLVNTGTAPVNVLDVKTSCGCTEVTGFRRGVLEPGASISMRISMTAAKTVGEQKTKKIKFTIEGQPPLVVPIHLTTIASTP